jgi:hypothetical protein
MGDSPIALLSKSTLTRPQLAATILRRTLMTGSNSKKILSDVAKIIPPLTGKLHKGQAGRVGVVGGSEELSGFLSIPLRSLC